MVVEGQTEVFYSTLAFGADWRLAAFGLVSYKNKTVNNYRKQIAKYYFHINNI